MLGRALFAPWTFVSVLCLHRHTQLHLPVAGEVPHSLGPLRGKSGSNQTDAGDMQDVNMPCSSVFSYYEHCLNL